MHRQRWIGIFSCFALFILVFISQKLHFEHGHLEHASGAELGLLLFLGPGIIASVLCHQRRIITPLLGALLAIPVCLLVVRIGVTPGRSFWQELAWICSAVFWCAIGSLAWLCFRALCRRSS